MPSSSHCMLIALILSGNENSLMKVTRRKTKKLILVHGLILTSFYTPTDVCVERINNMCHFIYEKH
jgi:hypothetical protein